jgi:hypothetical protein
MSGDTPNIAGAVSGSVMGLGDRIISFLPELISAILILVVGIVVAKLLAGLVRRTLKLTGVDAVGRDTGIHRFLEIRGMDFSFTNTISWLVKWFFLLAFFVAAINVLGISQLTGFINSIITYIPNVIVAVVILSVGLIATKYVGELVERSARVSDALRSYSDPLGKIASGAIVAFAVMAALIQLGIAANLITILFTGLVAMLAIAGGLAFGLGGRDNAKRLLEKFERQSGAVDQAVAYAASEEDVRECLIGKEFPAPKEEVVNYCKDSGARTVLENIDDREYTSLTDVVRGLRNLRKAFH